MDRKFVTAQYLDCISVLTSFGPPFRCIIVSKLSASPPDTPVGSTSMDRAGNPTPLNPIINVKRAKMQHFMHDIQFFLGRGITPSPVLQLINLIFVTIQQDAIMQSLSDYFNVSINSHHHHHLRLL